MESVQIHRIASMPKKKAQEVERGQGFDPDHLRTRDVLLFILLLCLWAGIRVEFGHDAAIKWGGLAVNSVILFAFLLYLSKEHFKRQYFWGLTGAFAAIHILGWTILLWHVETWGLLSFGLMAFEAPLFLYLRNRPIA